MRSALRKAVTPPVYREEGPVRRRPLETLDDHHLDGRTSGFELEAQLLLDRREDRRHVLDGVWPRGVDAD
jgi:hypothetical protein